MPNVRTLSTDELRQRLAQGARLQLWNVQTDQLFAGELIPGSRRMRLDTIDRATAAIPKTTEIITYCGGARCAQSLQATRRLVELGYSNVRAYTDGLEGWKAAGHPIEDVRQPASAA